MDRNARNNVNAQNQKKHGMKRGGYFKNSLIRNGLVSYMTHSSDFERMCKRPHMRAVTAAAFIVIVSLAGIVLGVYYAVFWVPTRRSPVAIGFYDT